MDRNEAENIYWNLIDAHNDPLRIAYMAGDPEKCESMYITVYENRVESARFVDGVVKELVLDNGAKEYFQERCKNIFKEL